MRQFCNVGVNPSVERIENAVHKNGGILYSFGYGYDLHNNSPTKQVGDWLIMLVDTRGMGNHGSFIAVAHSKETAKMQRDATMRILRHKADAAEQQGSIDFQTRGDFACEVVPLLYSRFFAREHRCFLFADEKWAYFAYSNANYLRSDDGRSRLWVHPEGRRRRSRRL